MWNHDELTRRLGIEVPIVQGPFGGGLSAVDLVVAVSDSGGLGSFGVHHLDGAGIRAVAREIRARTRRPFALNLWIPLGDSNDPRLSEEQWRAACERLRPYFEKLGVPMPERPRRFSPNYEEQIETLLEVAPPVFSFVFGVPSGDVLQRCRSAGIATVGTATTADEAKLLADAGVDMVVATGLEAGGHRVSFLRESEDCLTGTMALVPQIADAVQVPVVASGGIADGRGVAAALALGAAAVQIGTAFLTCDEAGIADAYKEAILAAREQDTRLTRAFSGRPARGLVNRFLREHGPYAPAAYPEVHHLTSPLRKKAAASGDAQGMALWAGQGHRMARELPAGQLVEVLAAEIDMARTALSGKGDLR